MQEHLRSLSSPPAILKIETSSCGTNMAFIEKCEESVVPRSNSGLFCILQTSWYERTLRTYELKYAIKNKGFGAHLLTFKNKKNTMGSMWPKCVTTGTKLLLNYYFFFPDHPGKCISLLLWRLLNQRDPPHCPHCTLATLTVALSPP